MAIREIPKSVEYRCDSCGETECKEAHVAHRICPPGWFVLRVMNHKGNEADSILLCGKCEQTKLPWTLMFANAEEPTCAK